MLANRTFRVFVSSTFSDLAAERNALQQRVFPALRQLCRERGARFQAVDLRWGVRDEAGLDQRTMAICLEELRRCQQTGLRPNFLILLGDRYGWRPLPQRIAAVEFEEMLGVLSPAERAALSSWYRRDDNALPPEYALRPRTGADADADHWARQEADLRGHFLQAIDRLNWPALDDRRHKYEGSATHQEIRAGALHVADAAAHVFCYQRELAALPAVADPQAQAFADYLLDGRSDADARQRLRQLKADLARELPADHVYHYQAPWDAWPEQAVLDAFCARVERDLRGVLEGELDRLENLSEVQREAQAHADFAAERARHFLGRDRERQTIRAYLTGAAAAPLLMHGRSGSGKTALLARAAGEAAGPGRVVVLRFLGATPAASELRALLEGLGREIADAYGDPRPVPTDLRELLDDLPRRLALATMERPLVLFLDAVDQLAATDNAHTLAWLPRALPAAVKVVVSALDEPGPAGACLEAARYLLPASHLISLEDLSDHQGEELLDTWLHEAGRTLQPRQRRTLLDGFAGCRLPLYLKLLAEEARLWRSDEDMPLPGADIPAVLNGLFDRLESPGQHGALLVRRSLAFLAAARHGLTEDELIDLLSADPEFFEDFLRRARHDLAEGQRRLPAVVWSRLYHDLRPYLTERTADGTVLLSFYHRQVAEAVAARYLGAAEGLHAHRSLAEYFAGQPKRFGASPNRRKLSEQPFQQTHARQWEELEATLTDLTFIEAKSAAGLVHDLQTDYAAAVHALPEAQAEREKEELHQQQLADCTRQLVAYARMWTTARGRQAADAAPRPEDVPLPEPIASMRPGEGTEVQMAAELPPGRLERIRAFAAFVAAEAAGLARSAGLPGFVLQQACNAAASGPVAAAAQAALDAGGREPLVLRHRAQLVPFNPRPALVRILQGHTEPVTDVGVTADGQTVVSAGGKDATVRVWDLATGLCRHTLTGHTRWVGCVAVTPDGRTAVSGGLDRTVRVWDLLGGRCVGVFEGHTSNVRCVAVTPDGGLAVSGSADHTLRVWDLAAGRGLRTLEGHVCSVDRVAVTPSGNRVVSVTDRSLRVWDVAGGQCVKSFPYPDRGVASLRVMPGGGIFVYGTKDNVYSVYAHERTAGSFRTSPGHDSACIQVTPDGRTAVSGERDRMLRVWDVVGGRCLRTLAGHPSWIECLAVTPDGRTAVSAGCDTRVHMDTAVRVWDLGGTSNGGVPETSGPVKVIRLSADGGTAVSVHDEGAVSALRSWDCTTAQCTGVMKAESSDFEAVCLTPNGRLAVAGKVDATLEVYDLLSGQCLGVLHGHTSFVGCLAAAADGRTIVSGSGDKTLRVWDLATGQCVRVLEGHTSAVWCLVLTPDGKTAVSGGGFDDHRIRVWDLAAGRCVRVLEGHAHAVHSLAVTPDGRTLVSGSVDDALRVWELASGRCLCIYPGAVRHDDRTGARSIISLTADGRWVLSGDGDVLHVWELATGARVAAYPTPGHAFCLSEVRRGGQLALGTDTGQVLFLRLHNLPPGGASPVRA